ncbi:PREDICTED: uncharacterized protein LOC109371976 [Hipposideros armiger]|uniref:Uncharacterized protein LOC109371976 n=1 Tax=Hipposideros armiger TaxID=186990 RepID=A0A8B7PYI8_HIPAR|nr:PREDICTED: uncharacterized protein LOC109371976 [Hipposideros armiger]
MGAAGGGGPGLPGYFRDRRRQERERDQRWRPGHIARTSPAASASSSAGSEAPNSCISSSEGRRDAGTVQHFLYRRGKEVRNWSVTANSSQSRDRTIVTYSRPSACASSASVCCRGSPARRLSAVQIKTYLLRLSTRAPAAWVELHIRSVDPLAYSRVYIQSQFQVYVAGSRSWRSGRAGARAEGAGDAHRGCREKWREQALAGHSAASGSPGLLAEVQPILRGSFCPPLGKSGEGVFVKV